VYPAFPSQARAPSNFSRNRRLFLGSGHPRKNAGNSRLTPSTRRILKSWLPSALWFAVIVLESTNLGSSENTSRILYPIFHFLVSMDPVRFAAWHHVLRKIGHFVGYFTLSVLLFRSWRSSFPRLSTSWCVQWATLAFSNTALVAWLDEWHQTSMPSRTGVLSDVVLDSCAGFTAQIVILLILRARASRTEQTVPSNTAPNSRREHFG
jgi:VanZ family protein